MTVLPGSLDYLYYNGILDHIPYEAYEMVTPVNSNSPMTGAQYLEQAKQGLNYNASLSDSFVGTQQTVDNIGTANHISNYNNVSYNNASYSQDEFIRTQQHDENVNVASELYGSDGKAVYDSVNSRAEEAKSKIKHPPTIIKGLVGLGLIAGTLFLILRGKK